MIYIMNLPAVYIKKFSISPPDSQPRSLEANQNINEVATGIIGRWLLHHLYKSYVQPANTGG
jgi:hypothetical protein